MAQGSLDAFARVSLASADRCGAKALGVQVETELFCQRLSRGLPKWALKSRDKTLGLMRWMLTQPPLFRWSEKAITASELLLWCWTPATVRPELVWYGMGGAGEVLSTLFIAFFPYLFWLGL